MINTLQNVGNFLQNLTAGQVTVFFLFVGALALGLFINRALKVESESTKCYEEDEVYIPDHVREYWAEVGLKQ